MNQKDYIITDEKIKKAYKEYISTHRDMPTQQEIADICNISRKTVNIHLKNIQLHDIIQPFKILGNKVLVGLYERAIKGDPQAVKLYMMLVHDWNEKIEEKRDETVHVIIERVSAQKKDAKEQISDN